MHLLLKTMLKVVQRSVKFTKTDGRNSSTQSCYFWKTINYKPCFLCFYGVDFLFLDIPTTADVPRFSKNSKAHAKLFTLKQFLECLFVLMQNTFFSNTSIGGCCCANYWKLYSIYQIVWNHWAKSSSSNFLVCQF